MAKARTASNSKPKGNTPLERFELKGKGHSPAKPANPLDRFPLNKVNTNL